MRVQRPCVDRRDYLTKRLWRTKKRIASCVWNRPGFLTFDVLTLGDAHGKLIASCSPKDSYDPPYSLLRFLAAEYELVWPWCLEGGKRYNQVSTGWLQLPVYFRSRESCVPCILHMGCYMASTPLTQQFLSFIEFFGSFKHHKFYLLSVHFGHLSAASWR